MTHHPLRRTALAIALSTLAIGAAHANMTLDLLGDKSPNLIDLQSLQLGVGVGISSAGGAGGIGRQIGKPSVSDITWTQGIDTTVPKLMTLAVTGKNTPTANFKLYQNGNNGPASFPYLTLQTSNNLVTGVSQSNASGGGTGSASASLNFDKFSMTYTPTLPGGQAGTKSTTTYDLAKNQVTAAAASHKPTSGHTTPTTDGIYLRLGSGSTSIYGDSTAVGYQNWIQIDSSQMGLGVAISPVGAGGNRTASRPSISELTITQQFDATVPVVLADLLKGKNIGQATLEYVTGAGSGKPVTFMQVVLNNVMFSGLSLSTGGELPSVSESLNFTGFSETVWDINADGSRNDKSMSRVCYDIATAKASCTGLDPVSATGFGAGNLLGTRFAAAEVGAPFAAPLLVPEPQTWLMMLAGVGVLAGAARRRQAG